MHTAILQSLFNMVKCQSTRIRVQVGITICNLLACSATNKAVHSLTYPLTYPIHRLEDKKCFTPIVATISVTHEKIFR